MRPDRLRLFDADGADDEPELMKPELDPRLEAQLDHALKSLPPIEAPAGLAPGVLAILAARARQPWWERAWWDWPLSAKAAFLVLTVAVAGLLAGGGLFFGEGAESYGIGLLDWLHPFVTLMEILAPLASAGLLVWETIGEPFLIYGALCIGALYLTCLGMGTACFRYALKRA